MRIIVFCNHKGGVGKTTLAGHLVYMARERKLRVLVISMDRQGDLIRWLNEGAPLPPDRIIDFGQGIVGVYSPDAFPTRFLTANVDLLIVEAPVQLNLISQVPADLFLIPIVDRFSLENMGHFVDSLQLRPGGLGKYVVFNRVGAGGMRNYNVIRRSAERQTDAQVWPVEIPESDVFERSRTACKSIWHVSHGKKSPAAKAMLEFGNSIFQSLGLG